MQWEVYTIQPWTYAKLQVMQSGNYVLFVVFIFWFKVL